jgi:hypothetical protein
MRRCFNILIHVQGTNRLKDKHGLGMIQWLRSHFPSNLRYSTVPCSQRHERRAINRGMPPISRQTDSPR